MLPRTYEVASKVKTSPIVIEVDISVYETARKGSIDENLVQLALVKQAVLLRPIVSHLLLYTESKLIGEDCSST